MRIIEELMNRRWILKSQDPQLYYEIKDNAKELKKEAAGEIRLCTHYQSISCKAGKDSRQSRRLDGDYRI